MGVRRRVERSAAKRRAGSVAAAAVIALLATYAARPLCPTALTCTMPCCEGSNQPMENHDGMPGCGGPARECSVARVLPSAIRAILSAQLEVPHALPAAAPHAIFDIAPPPGSAHAPLVQPRSSPRRLYVVNDVFLI